MSQDEQRQSKEDLEVEEGRICGMYVVFFFSKLVFLNVIV